jgi:hypothetical protein
MIMQLALRPYVSVASVAVLGVGLICVTPAADPRIEQLAVQLTAVEALSDLVGPIDTVVSSLGGLSTELSGVLPSLGDISGTLADAASALPADTLELFDPAFWQQFWADLLDPTSGGGAWLMLTGAFAQLPVIGPFFGALGLAGIFFGLGLVEVWDQILHALGIQPFAAAAEGLGTGLQALSDTALAGAIDPALPAGVATGLADIPSLFSGAVAVLDPSAVVQDISTATDPIALTSILDLAPIADIGTAIDPAAIADIGAVVDVGTISDLGGMLTSLIP